MTFLRRFAWYREWRRRRMMRWAMRRVHLRRGILVMARWMRATHEMLLDSPRECLRQDNHSHPSYEIWAHPS